MICAVLYGFNVASIGVVVFEVNAILAGPELSAIGIGYSLLFSGCGGLMGPPAAGEESSQAYIPKTCTPIQVLPPAKSFVITNSDLNRPCFAWHPYGKSGLFKTELVIVVHAYSQTLLLSNCNSKVKFNS